MTTADWVQDKRWSDRFLPEIKQILGLHLIGEAPSEEDEQRNTDLIVLKMDAVRIGCRVRRHKYLERYGAEFTIRSDRPNGTKTELAKIIEGWGDYFFYGYSCEREERLAFWFLGDLRPFRLWLFQKLARDEKPWINKNNVDKSSAFVAFNLTDMPSDFVVAKYDELSDG